MRSLFVSCLTLAALAPQAALGQPKAPRDIVFECPCSAVYSPAEDGSGGAVEVDFNVRSFRGSRSMGLGLQTQYGRGVTVDADYEGRALVFPDGVPALSRLSPPVGGSAPAALPYLVGSGALHSHLVEFYGGQSAEGVGGNWAVLDSLTLWPVPGAQPDGRIHYVDILTDSDGDGVGDVNEWIAAGWKPGRDAPAPDPAQDPDSTPAGPSEVDVLWLHPESWGAESVAEYRHAAAVAGHLFADSGAAVRLRPAAFVPVPDDKVDSWEAPLPLVDPGWLSVEADGHGADAAHVAGGAAGRGMALGTASGYFIPFGEPGEPRGASSSSTLEQGAFVIAHELGHVFGLAHSAAQGEAYGTFRHSRGHYLHHSGSRRQADYTYGTIMSYGDDRLTPVFSSPNSGLCEPFGPCGLPANHPEGADAVSSLNILRYQIAAVRDPKPSAGNGGADGPDLRDWFRTAAVQAAFEAKLGKPAGAITEDDMRGIRELDAALATSGDGLEVSLAGFERAVNLTELTLRGEGAGLRIPDLSPLAGLPLESLEIQKHRGRRLWGAARPVETQRPAPAPGRSRRCPPARPCAGARRDRGAFGLGPLRELDFGRGAALRLGAIGGA